PPSGYSVYDVRSSPDGKRAVYSVRSYTVGSAFHPAGVYSVSTGGGRPPVRLSAGDPTSIAGSELTRDGRRVVYLADQETRDVDELSSVPVDGAAPPFKLNPSPRSPAGDVRSFALSHDGSRVVFTSTLVTLAEPQLYSAPVDGSAPAVLLDGP